MELDQIQPEQASVQVGVADAPVQIVEYINLRCPDSKHYEEEVASLLKSYIEREQVVRYLKHFDKHKGVLERGQWAYDYLPVLDNEAACQWIQFFFQNQADWGSLESHVAIAHYAEAQGLTLFPEAKVWHAAVQKEIEAVGVERIPTVIVNGTPLIEKITSEELQAAVESALHPGA
ncbi:MAG: thioredoxin domain-containing protein [Aerococcus sp.]|nr:thioredoxin domain-containing protein [Aerococcus sp.]